MPPGLLYLSKEYACRQSDDLPRQLTRPPLRTLLPGKKFREFINTGAYLDVKPNDDIIDILGFLAFEVVRELCVGAVALKQSLEEESAILKRLADGSKNRKNLVENGEAAAAAAATSVEDGDDGASARGAASVGESSLDTAKGTASSDEKAATAMKRRNTQTSANGANGATASKRTKREASPQDTTCGLFTMPPAKASPLMTSHVREAFARLQRDRSALSTGSGGIPGGLKRTRVFVI